MTTIKDLLNDLINDVFVEIDNLKVEDFPEESKIIVDSYLEEYETKIEELIKEEQKREQRSSKTTG